MNALEVAVGRAMILFLGVFLLVLGCCIALGGVVSAVYHAEHPGGFAYARHAWDQGSWLLATGASLLALRSLIG